MEKTAALQPGVAAAEGHSGRADRRGSVSAGSLSGAMGAHSHSLGRGNALPVSNFQEKLISTLY